MVLDCALADAEVGGDVLVRVAGKHPFHHLALSLRETRELGRGRFSQIQQFARNLATVRELCRGWR